MEGWTVSVLLSKMDGVLGLKQTIRDSDKSRSCWVLETKASLKWDKWTTEVGEIMIAILRSFSPRRAVEMKQGMRKDVEVKFSHSVVSDSLRPMNCSVPGLPVHHQLLESTQTHAHRVGDAIQPSHPLLSPSPPAPNPSQHQGLFQWVNSLHEVAKVLEFQLSISPSNEHPGLISFRMDWLDLLAVHGTLKSLIQHHSSKASIFRSSAFFIDQLSHPYMTTGKP